MSTGTAHKGKGTLPKSPPWLRRDGVQESRVEGGPAGAMVARHANPGCCQANGHEAFLMTALRQTVRFSA